MKYSDEDAAAGIFTLILVFLLASILFIVIGYGIDRFTVLASSMFTNTVAAQARFDTVNIMLLVFRAEPFVLLFGIGYNYWVGEMRQFTAMADVGTMIVAAAEMITMTLVLIAFTLFGGYGLDMVTNFVNNYSFSGADPSLFMAVQYIAPMFYGAMFLILIGVLVQFVMTCVRTIDYTQAQYY